MSSENFELIRVVEIGHLKTVSTLLKLGVDVNKYNGKKSALFIAVENGDYKIAKLLIKYGANLDFQEASDNWFTSLHVAVKGRKPSIVDLLLKSGANVNIRSRYGNTPLHSAVEREKDINSKSRYFVEEDKNIVEMLLASGADVNAARYSRDSTKFQEGTALHLLASHGSAEILKQFAAIYDNYSTFIHNWEAAQEDICTSNQICKEIAELLINKGANIHANYESETILHSAATSKNMEIVKLLLQYDVDVNAKDKYENTPLHCLFMIKEKYEIKPLDTVRNEIGLLLIKKGADINATNNRGKTILHLASHVSLEFVKILARYDVDVNSKDKNGNSPLHHTCFNSFYDCSEMELNIMRKEIAKILINNGTDIHATNENGQTVLHLAADHENVEIMEHLLKCRAKINSRDKYGCTPIHFAAKLNNIEVLKLILESDGDVNSRCNIGKTPLHCALTNYVFGVKGVNIIVLLEYGADINLECDTNKTPFYYITKTESASFKNLIRVLIGHIVKLSYLNCHVSKNIFEALSTLQGDEDLYSECMKEIQNMQKRMICGTNITAFDLLTKNSQILCNYVKNENIVHVYLSQELNVEFPMYASNLNIRLCLAVKRRGLVNKCTEILHHISSKLSSYDLETICSYLNEMDMKIMISAHHMSKV